MKALDNYVCEGQISIFDWLDPDTWSGKTCQEPSVQTKEKTSERSLKKPQKSAIKTPLFLDLRTENGVLQDVSWEMGGLLLGEYMMRSFGEYPSEENVSLLSQILEETPHPKYCLSPKACQGILRRAEKRGKKLPELLEKTLIKQSAFKNEPESQGGGKGILIQHERTGALSTLNNQPVCYGISSAVCMWDGTQISPTLTANNAGGAQRMPDKENFNAVIQGRKQSNSDLTVASFYPQMKAESQCWRDDDISNTLVNGTNPGFQNAICYGVDCYNQTQTEEQAKTLTSGRNDKNNIPCVYGIDQQGGKGGANYTVNVAPTLASDSHGTPHGVVYGLDRASFNQGQNAQYDFSIEEEKAQTLVAKGPGGVMSRQSVPYVQEITKE